MNQEMFCSIFGLYPRTPLNDTTKGVMCLYWYTHRGGGNYFYFPSHAFLECCQVGSICRVLHMCTSP